MATALIASGSPIIAPLAPFHPLGCLFWKPGIVRHKSLLQTALVGNRFLNQNRLEIFCDNGSAEIRFSRQTKSNFENQSPMQLNSPILFAQFHSLLQCHLSPLLESAIGPLSKPNQLLASVVSLLPLAAALPPASLTGRPPADRQALFIAFLAKAVYNLVTTRQLLDRLQHDRQLYRLCGWTTRGKSASQKRRFAQQAPYSLALGLAL